MVDLKLFESGNGGDLLLSGYDLAKAYTFDNFPYLAMFGGNPKYPTPVARISSEQAFDFWGNSIFLSDSKDEQFNSYTEAALDEVDLNSNGRLKIEEAVKKDLRFMSPYSEVKVNVQILGQEKVGLGITILQPENGVNREFMYIWDGSLLLDETLSYTPKPPQIEGLEEVLEYDI
jgi:hypothetical protein